MADVSPTDLLAVSDFLPRWTNQEFLALQQKLAADIAAGNLGNAKNWAIVIGSGVLRLDSQKVNTLKANLVADGVLSQARADAIFS